MKVVLLFYAHTCGRKYKRGSEQALRLVYSIVSLATFSFVLSDFTDLSSKYFSPKKRAVKMKTMDLMIAKFLIPVR